MDELISSRDFEENRHSLAEIQRRETSKTKIKPNYFSLCGWYWSAKLHHHIPAKCSARFVLCTKNKCYRLSDLDTIVMRVTKEDRYQATEACKSLVLAKYQLYKKISRSEEAVFSVAYSENDRQNSRSQDYYPDPRILTTFITLFSSTVVLYVCTLQ